MEYRNIRSFGASGNGAADDASSFQSALDAAGGIYLPSGRYLIGRTLHMRSRTRIKAAPDACVVLADVALKKRGDYLLTADGADDIGIEGGVWDGNNPGNPRDPDLFSSTAFPGIMLNFHGVRDLSLRNMTLRDPETFYVCLCDADGFLIEDIVFDSPHIRPNQDGIHLAGGCQHGVIRRLRGYGMSPNDDLVAINADDYIGRIENHDLHNGYIRDLIVDDISAECCHTFIRIANVDSDVSRIYITGVKGKCANFAVNMDCLRYCRTPLFPPDDPRYTDGVGTARDIHIKDMDVSRTEETDHNNSRALICLETNIDDFTVENFRTAGVSPSLKMTNTCRHILEFEDLEKPETLTLEGALADGGAICKPLRASVTLGSGGFGRLCIRKTKDT